MRIAITPGEPAGIGPDLIAQIAAEKFPAELIVIADKRLLEERAKILGLAFPGHLNIIDVPLFESCIPGKLNKANAAYVLQTLQLAGEGCMSGKFNAVVTGPVHKAIINQAGFPFLGHTEFFAQLTQTPQVVMMLLADKLRVALVTTHLPLSQVSKAITAEKLEKILLIVNHELQKRFAITQPKIFVAGLNPHAGEDGLLGREEIEIITPVLNKLRNQGMDLIGPLPADTLFLPKYLNQADAIVTMYHDQGLPVLKYAAFDQAVNVTLGMPIIRTSVDHGTALDLAGTGKADVGSFKAAINMAILMSHNQT